MSMTLRYFMTALGNWRCGAKGSLSTWGTGGCPLNPYRPPTSAPATFLGYVLDPRGRRLPDETVRRFRNRLRSLRDRWRQGHIDERHVRDRVQAWIAHASFADTRALQETIFREGWFDPRRPRA